MRYQAGKTDERPNRSSDRSIWAPVRRIVPTAGVALALMAAVVSPASAQAPTTVPDDPEKARQENQQRQQEVAGQLDTAKATVDQLEKELERLESEVRAGESRLAAARAAQAAAEKRVSELQGEVAQAEAAVASAKKEAQEQAVAAYMRPDRETASQVLAADDPQEFAKMRALVDDLATRNRAVIRERTVAENLLRQKKAEAEQAKVDADRAARQAADALVQTTRARDARAAVKVEIDKRIQELAAEQAALDAQEEQLVAIIAERQRQAEEAARQRAEAERQRRAAEAAEAARRGAPAPAAPPSSGAVSARGLMWPAAGGMTSRFGPRWGTMHKGIDIGGPTGAPIWAAADGEVIFAGVQGGYGNAVLIAHGDGLVTLYGHQSRIAVSNGQVVTRGQVIGYIGSTGHSTGPHLHFETRVNGAAQNPLNYLP